MAANDNRGVGVREQLGSGAQVVGRSGQRVLVGAPVKMFAHQLLWCGVLTSASSGI